MEFLLDNRDSQTGSSSKHGSVEQSACALRTSLNSALVDSMRYMVPIALVTLILITMAGSMARARSVLGGPLKVCAPHAVWATHVFVRHHTAYIAATSEHTVHARTIYSQLLFFAA